MTLCLWRPVHPRTLPGMSLNQFLKLVWTMTGGGRSQLSQIDMVYLTCPVFTKYNALHYLHVPYAKCHREMNVRIWKWNADMKKT